MFQSYFKYPSLSGSERERDGGSSCSSSLPAGGGNKYQKKQKSVFHNSLSDRHKMKVNAKTNTYLIAKNVTKFLDLF